MNHDKDPLIIFDTSALVYYLSIPVGYTILNSKYNESQINELRDNLKDKSKINLKDSASQLECMLLGNEIGKRKKLNARPLVPQSDVENIKKNLKPVLEEGFENWRDSQKCADELDTIQNYQRFLVSNPRNPDSIDWLVKKRNQLNISVEYIHKMPNSKRREYLNKLCKNAKKGNDTKMLAQAYKIAKEHNVFFISDDGDHVTLDKFMRRVTKNKLKIMYIKDVTRNLNQFK